MEEKRGAARQSCRLKKDLRTRRESATCTGGVGCTANLGRKKQCAQKRKQREVQKEVRLGRRRMIRGKWHLPRKKFSPANTIEVGNEPAYLTEKTRRARDAQSENGHGQKERHSARGERKKRRKIDDMQCIHKRRKKEGGEKQTNDSSIFECYRDGRIANNSVPQGGERGRCICTNYSRRWLKCNTWR